MSSEQSKNQSRLTTTSTQCFLCPDSCYRFTRAIQITPIPVKPPIKGPLKIMETSTTIRNLFTGNTVSVPAFLRPYSWDTEFESSKPPKQVDIFLSDLENHKERSTNSKYYFGHFLFEEKTPNDFAVIDGQQRLTTITIFLSALFTRLKAIRQLSEYENEVFEDIIKRKSVYRFRTVDEDNQLFKDIVIDQIKKDNVGFKTESTQRIVDAFQFFTQKLADKDQAYLVKMLKTIQDARCTTHIATDKSEVTQMYISQNCRGKKHSSLETIKATRLFNAPLYPCK